MFVNLVGILHGWTMNAENPQDQSQHVDVAVIGGGAAGLSAGLVLARSRRSVVVIDAGEQRNRPAGHVHNYLTSEGMPPLEIVATGRAEVESYGGQVLEGRVVTAQADEGDHPSFTLTLADGGVVEARRVVIATGATDRLPDVPGLAERWGRDVLHCPYCHGWEVRDQRIGVLATSANALHQVGLFRQLSEHVTLVAGDVELDHHALMRLRVRGVDVVSDTVAEVLATEDRLSGVRLTGGEVLELDALVVAPFFEARADIAEQLGLVAEELEMNGTVLGTTLEADAMGLTSVPGVYVAGNANDFGATVIGSAAAGMRAGAIANAQLVEEDSAVALVQWAASMREPKAWDERYGAAEASWSGRVNPQLPTVAATLTPGTALDIGSGEGADVIWLAQNGWQATGMDFSQAGLDRSAAHAAEAGATERTQWLLGDVRTWRPSDVRWDLVVGHYVHLPLAQMRGIVPQLADAVAPAGTLLLVWHHPGDADPGHRRDDMFTAEEVADVLDPEVWDVSTSAEVRTGTGMGHDVEVRDTVLRATRR